MLVHSQSFEAEEAKSIERAEEASNESNELLAMRLKASNEVFTKLAVPHAGQASCRCRKGAPTHDGVADLDGGGGTHGGGGRR